MAFINSGKKGKRAGDVTNVLSTGEHFNQQNFLIPSITGYTVAGGSDYEADDLALDTAGGQTLTITGSGFKSGAQVRLDNSVIGSVTVTNTAISFTAPAKTAGTYSVYVTNPGGGTAILTPGVLYSGDPNWTSPAAGAELGPYYETTDYLDSFVATNPDNGSSPIVYSLYDGAFPAGATLDSNAGTLSGTAPVDAGSTTYSFTMKATDSDQQDTLRSFTLTVNADVVTWSTPDTTQNLGVDTQISPLILSASSAAGYGVSYAYDSLPTGLSFADDSISGTPTVTGSSYTTLTATAATTSRTATRTISWTISVGGDTDFPDVNFLIQADTSGASTSNSVATDQASTGTTLTVSGDPDSGSASPYYDTPGSVYFDGSSYHTYTLGSECTCTGDFTLEFWWYNNHTTWGNYSMMGGSFGSKPAIYGDGGGILHLYDGTLNLTFAGGTRNAWHHFAIVKSGSGSSNIKAYRDGAQVGVTTSSSTVDFSGTFYVGYGNGYNYTPKGYICQLRLVNGTALYTTTFDRPTYALEKIANTEFLAYTGPWMGDISDNGKVPSVTGWPYTTTLTPLTAGPVWEAYSTSTHAGSMYFDDAGDYITSTANNAHRPSTDFTIECWFKPDGSLDSTNGIFTIGNTSNQAAGITVVGSTTSGALDFWVNGFNNKTTTSTGIPQLNVWQHVALVRNGSTNTLYVNGQSVGSNQNTPAYSGTTLIRLASKYGDAGGTTEIFKGWLSDFRYTKSAVYTANFVPPHQALSSASAYMAVPFNEARIYDTAGKNNIDLFGSPVVDTSIKKFGTGSIDFGSSSANYINLWPSASSIPSHLYTGTGNFTLEWWMYCNSGTGRTLRIMHKTGYIVIGNTTNAYGVMNTTGSGTTGFTNIIDASSSITAQTWTYCALVRSSGTFTLYQGTSGSVSSVGTSTTGGTDNFSLTEWGKSGFGGMNGYLDDIRFTKGVARTITSVPAAAFIGNK